MRKLSSLNVITKSADMEIFACTSGWSYDWNERGTLDWYAAGSGLNAIELNFSFYRSPTSKMAASWAEKGRSLRWAVKINRVITHIYRLDHRAIELWKKIREALKPLEPSIDFFSSSRAIWMLRTSRQS